MQLTSLSLALTRAGLGGFSPAALFLYGEQGVWYEPSLTNGTCFQDAAGTTPVTAVEQPVGLILDKSKGLVLGPELVTNGTFDSDITAWTNLSIGTGTVSWSSNGIRLVGTSSTDSGRAQQAISVQVGKTYQFRCNGAITSGSATVGLGTVSGSAPGALALALSATTVGYFVATATPMYVVLRVNSGGGDLAVDNISVRELPGNHAYQTTSTSRPVLSARYNLLTKTEQFDDAAWTKNNATVTANAAVSPDGTMTAASLTRGAVTGSESMARFSSAQLANTAYTLSVYAKAGTAGAHLYIRNLAVNNTLPNGLAVFNIATGETLSVGSAYSSATISAVGAGWYRCSIVGVTPASIANNLVDVGTCNASGVVSGGVGDSIYIWGASLVPANQSSIPYQRVNTATDYDADPAKFKPYLKFDGVDDFLVTNSIDFTSTDKMTVFAGVRKLSDAATAFLTELSADLNTNPGVFAIAAPGSISPLQAYRFVSKGTNARGVGDATVPTAPTTDVITGVGNISGDQSILRVDGAQVASNTGDQGAGNYGNYPLYIGRRGGTTLPFNGYLYSLIVRGAQTSDTQVSQTETWVNSRTGAY